MLSFDNPYLKDGKLSADDGTVFELQGKIVSTNLFCTSPYTKHSAAAAAPIAAKSFPESKNFRFL